MRSSSSRSFIWPCATASRAAWRSDSWISAAVSSSGGVAPSWPTRATAFPIDISTGITAAFAIASALYRRAETGEGLREEAAAAAHIEHGEPVQGVLADRVPAKARRGAIANVGEPHRIELVQRRERSRFVPPMVRQTIESLDLVGVDAHGCNPIFTQDLATPL